MARRDTLAPGERGSSPPDSSDAPCRVLVVDDEPANLDTFRRVFRRDFEMAFASSGGEAIAHMRGERFDVAVVDYAMPEMNGLEFLRYAAVLQPEMARLMVTAHDSAPELRESRASGLIISIIPKPWSRDQIIQCIGTAQRMAKMRASVQRLGEVMRK